MSEIWIQIPEDYPLRPGNHVLLHCEWLTDNLYTRAAQWALIESKLQKTHPEFSIVSFNNGPDLLTIEVRITERPVVLQTAMTVGALAIALGIITVLGIFGMSLLKYTASLDTGAQTAYAQTTTAKIEAAKWPLIALAALAAVVIFGLVKLK